MAAGGAAAVVTRLLGPGARFVWRNELGGVTFRTDELFAKWQPPGPFDLRTEAEKLAWAGQYVTVPEPLDAGADNAGSWLLTRALRGESAVAPRWLADPVTAVRAIGTGLRELHDTLPVAGCPFSWDAEMRIERARLLGTAGDRPLEPPPIDRLVVCHGDPCSPNTLVGAHGRCTGHVDLGGLGLADRHADLAVATWSTAWNFGPGWEGALLDGYGIEPDAERTAYYRLMWDLSP